MNATIVSLIGFGPSLASRIVLVGTAGRAEKHPSKLNGGRSSHAGGDEPLLPWLLHPLAFDATASEFDDVPRRQFIPVNWLRSTRGAKQAHPPGPSDFRFLLPQSCRGAIRGFFYF